MNVDRPTHGLRVPWKPFHRHHRIKDGERAPRLALFNIIPNKIKGHVVAFAGELVGTFLFLLFALGGTNVVNTAPVEGDSTIDLAANPSKIMFIALCFGMSLAVNAWVFFRISGGLFNPAVTFGIMLVGATDYVRGPLIIVAQILGGICASAVVAAMMPNVLAMFLTAQLVFTIFMLATEKHAGTFIAPIGIGLSLFVAELMGVYYTGGSLNPARSFGPAVVVRKFASYHWIYWIGPILGSLLASAFYTFIKALEYETADLEKDSGKISATNAKPVIEPTPDPDNEKEIRSVNGSTDGMFAQGPRMGNGNVDAHRA